MYLFIFRKPVLMCINDQELANLHGSVIFHILHRLALFLGPSYVQMSSFNG